MTDHLLQTIQSLFIVFVCMFVCVRNGERMREREVVVVCFAKRLVAMMNHCHGTIYSRLVACFQKKMILKVDCGRKYVRRSPSFFL